MLLSKFIKNNDNTDKVLITWVVKDSLSNYIVLLFICYSDFSYFIY